MWLVIFREEINSWLVADGGNKKFEGGQRNRSFHPFSVILYRIRAALVYQRQNNFNYLLKEREGNIPIYLCFIRFLLLLSGFTFSCCLIRSLLYIKYKLFIFLFSFFQFLTRGDVSRFREEKTQHKHTQGIALNASHERNL